MIYSLGMFVLGMLFGSASVGGVVGWWLINDDWMILTGWLVAKRGMLETLTIRVRLQAEADARLERALLDKVNRG